MGQKYDELLDHDYDGIREYDNPLPRWWLWLLYGTVAFAVFYLPWVYFGYGKTGPQEYQMEMAEAAKAAKAAEAAAAPAQPAAPPVQTK